MVFFKKWFFGNKRVIDFKNNQKDYLLSHEVLIEQANQGQLSAKFLVFYGMLEGRFGFVINVNEGAKFLKKLTRETTETPACCAIARQYTEAQSFKKALLYLSNVENEQYVPGLYLLAKIKYLMCLKEEQRNIINKAEQKNIISIIKKCCSEKYSPAITFLGKLYLDGWGVRRNIRKGLRLLMQAAKNGDCPAKICLGRFYEESVSDKFPPNLSESKKWYVSAAAQNSTEAIQKLREIEKSAKIIEWPANNLEKMLKIGIRKSNLKHPKHKWELLVEGNKMIVKEVGKDIVFTILDDDSSPDRFVKFRKDVVVSEREAKFAILINSSPIVLNSESLEHVDVILKTAIKLNNSFKEEALKSIVKISDIMLDQYKNKWELLDPYPVVKIAVKEQIITSAFAALNNESTIQNGNIDITIRDDGWLILSGQVSFCLQKQLAEQCLSALHGIKGIINKIQIKPNLTSDEIKNYIIKELEENLIDLTHVAIEVEGKAVILKGVVLNWSDMDMAIDIAWAVPGVSYVDNQLKVSTRRVWF